MITYPDYEKERDFKVSCIVNVFAKDGENIAYSNEFEGSYEGTSEDEFKMMSFDEKLDCLEIPKPTAKTLHNLYDYVEFEPQVFDPYEVALSDYVDDYYDYQRCYR